MHSIIENRIIVVDLDDTLYLERDYVRSGCEAASELFTYDDQRYVFMARCEELIAASDFSMILNRALRAVHDAAGKNVDITVNDLLYTYRTHEPEIELQPDALEFINWYVHKTGHPIDVITDGPALRQELKLRALGIKPDVWPVYPSVIGAEKPNSWAFQLVQTRHPSYGGKKFVYIGDNPRKDFYAPRKLGWKAVRIKRPGGLYEEYPTRDTVDLEITSFEELLG